MIEPSGAMLGKQNLRRGVADAVLPGVRHVQQIMQLLLACGILPGCYDGRIQRSISQQSLRGEQCFLRVFSHVP